MKTILLRVLMACISGPVGYFATHLLLAFGVPLDLWAQKVSASVGIRLTEPQAFWLVATLIWIGVWFFSIWLLGFRSRPLEKKELNADTKPNSFHPASKVVWKQTRAITDENPDGEYEWIGAGLKRDVQLYDAICRAFSGQWELIGIAPDSPGIGQRESDRLHDLVTLQIRQKAFDGLLPIWGRHSNHDIWREIPKQYWADHEIDWYSFIACMREKNGNSLITTTKGNRNLTGNWIDLMTCRAVTDQLWPEKAP